MDDPRVETIFMEDGGVEYHSSYRNEHGTGYELIVSNPLDGLVDIVLYEIICHEMRDEPSISLSLPPGPAIALLRAINGGVNTAVYVARLKKFH